MKYLLCLTSLSVFSKNSFAQQQLPQFGKDSITQVVAAMTLQEKVKLLVGMGFRFGGATASPKKTTDTVTKEGFKMPPLDPADVAVPEKVPGSAGRTHAIARLGIPSITVSDGPAGVHISPFRNNDSSKSYYATGFPVGTLLASSWDTALVQRVGAAMGAEAHEYGIDIMLGPGMNIQRNPLGGRNFEYYSEDPLLSGNIAAAMVRGVQSNGVGSSIKHFAANNGESNRTMINTVVSERALREIYLRNFEIAIKESSPWTIMTSYNLINGVYTSQNSELLISILRDEWGFKGFVMSDWGGGKNPVAQVNAENDLLMPGNLNQTKAILNAVDSGKIAMKMIDRNVENILNVILLSPASKNYQHTGQPDLRGDAAIARSAAAQSMVLLKNENTLPLTEKKSVALFGDAAYDLIAGGSGSGDVNKAYKISLKGALENSGYSVNDKLTNQYKKYLTDITGRWPKAKTFLDIIPPIPDMKVEKEMIDRAAEESDMAIFTIGRNSGEGADRKVENDFNLSSDESLMVAQIADAFHKKGKKLIVVLNIGGVIETASWRDRADAILLAWQPGLEGGNAITDVLTGKQNPSGKLAISFPMKYADVPSSKNFPGHTLKPPTKDQPIGDKAAEVVYEDGIYVGYRYYQGFHVKPAYAFGYGMSYTKFYYSNLTLSGASFRDKIIAHLTVKNTGNTAGKEIVQLYLSAPARIMDKPEEELKGFAKTRLLSPGESAVIQFTLDTASLASFDETSTHWVADAGVYQVKIGSASDNIQLTKPFTLAKEIQLPKLHKVLVPAVKIDEMEATGD